MAIRVAVYGLGPIGILIAKETLKKKDLNLVAAFDIDPLKIGKDLGDIIGVEEKIGIYVDDDANALQTLKNSGVKVVLHSTSTYLDKNYTQIVKCIEAGANVISTSETLSNPWVRYPELATLLDELAKKYCISIIGTGINPGFIFDTLPIVMTSVCTEVNNIHVIRSLDASKRRYSFQKKYGLGLKVDDFKDKMEKGELTAHTGYSESINLIANALGVNLDKIIEGQEPLIAKKDMKTQFFNVREGQVSGIHGFGVGFLKEKEFIKIELSAEVDGVEFEEVTIEGTPPIKWRSSGISGDIATAAMVINMIPKILTSKPGLRRMCDIPYPSAFLSLENSIREEG